MKFIIVTVLLFFSSLSYGADIEDCSAETQQKLNDAYNCIYNGPSGCDFDVTESARVEASQILQEAAERNVEFSCDEYNELATLLLEVLQNN